MKNLILQVIVCAGALLPLSQIQAATYGGFAPGKTFTFTVKSVSSSKTVGTKVTANVPVPTGIPKFAKGQKVKFTIGSKGQLTGPGFSIPFKADAGTANNYVTVPTATKPSADSAIVFKSTAKVPTAASLHFFKVSISGFTATTNAVVYILQ